MVNEYSREEIIQKELDDIYIGNLNTVDSDLMLPGKGKYGADFEWETGEERFIEADGKIHRPLHGMGDRKVRLKVTASYEGAFGEREFAVTVLQEAKETLIDKIRDTKLTVRIGEKAKLPSVVIVSTADGRLMTMPVKWEEYEPLKEAGALEITGSIPECGQKAKADLEYCEEAGGKAKADLEHCEEAGRKEKVVLEHCEEADGKAKAIAEQKCRRFSMHQIRLLEGTLYYEYQKRMLEYLAQTDDDQMLYNFRKACGLDTLGAKPMTGWDADDCKLKGHTTGHYLSGLALAWGAAGDEQFLKKINYMVEELSKCQQEFSRSGECRDGFLSAYSEEQFDLLEQFTRYPEIWAPYYTLDKIMSGLYDCYQLAQNEKAKEILSWMGDWVYDRLSRLPKETLDRMWSMYIAGEFGGMQGTMAKLYQITGKDTHLKAARFFDNEKLFYPMEQNCDTLEDMHANQHIPQILGAMEMFKTTGEADYLKIGTNFWNIVTGGHIYSNGGTGETEMFHRAGTTCAYLTEKSAESCASYNMLRLTSQLFSYTADGGLMDYYDNTLRNHILTSCTHVSDGGTTYFLPLGPGMRKEYSTTENTCCHGTGMESRFRYMEDIYSYDDEFVYVNLLIDSAVSGEAAIEQKCVVETGEVRIRCLKKMDKKLKIHIPSWSQEEFQAIVNGERLEALALEKGYVCIPQLPAEDFEVVLKLSMKLHILENSSDNSLVSLAYGPYMLAALSDEEEFLPLPDLEKMQSIDGRGHFEVDGMKFVPFAEVDLEAYHVYFRRK